MCRFPTLAQAANKNGTRRRRRNGMMLAALSWPFAEYGQNRIAALEKERKIKETQRDCSHQRLEASNKEAASTAKPAPIR